MIKDCQTKLKKKIPFSKFTLEDIKQACTKSAALSYNKSSKKIFHISNGFKDILPEIRILFQAMGWPEPENFGGDEEDNEDIDMIDCSEQIHEEFHSIRKNMPNRMVYQFQPLPKLREHQYQTAYAIVMLGRAFHLNFDEITCRFVAENVKLVKECKEIEEELQTLSTNCKSKLNTSEILLVVIATADNFVSTNLESKKNENCGICGKGN